MGGGAFEVITHGTLENDVCGSDYDYERHELTLVVGRIVDFMETVARIKSKAFALERVVRSSKRVKDEMTLFIKESTPAPLVANARSTESWGYGVMKVYEKPMTVDPPVVHITFVDVQKIDGPARKVYKEVAEALSLDYIPMLKFPPLVEPVSFLPIDLYSALHIIYNNGFVVDVARRARLYDSLDTVLSSLVQNVRAVSITEKSANKAIAELEDYVSSDPSSGAEGIEKVKYAVGEDSLPLLEVGVGVVKGEAVYEFDILYRGKRVKLSALGKEVNYYRNTLTHLLPELGVNLHALEAATAKMMIILVKAMMLMGFFRRAFLGSG